MEAIADERERLEYSHGVVLAQGEPSQDHETIVSNLTLLIGPTIRLGGCRFWMKQNLKRPGSFSHDPDFLVSCSADDLGPGDHRKRGLIRHPALVIEVLSSSTRAFDLDDKVANYATYESLLEYIIIDTLRQRVIRYHRELGTEEFRVQHITDVIHCRPFSPASGIAVADLYDGTFEPQIDVVR
jgi:Uma2 family endonuclease